MLFILAALAPAVRAQPSPIVDEVRFSGDLEFPVSVLEARVRTAPNRRFLGLPGFSWWLWLYQLGESGVLGRRVSRALVTLGEPPARLDEDQVAADADRLRRFYEGEGYRQAQVQVRMERTSARAAVTFEIDPGRMTFVRRVRYTGIGTLTDAQQEQLAAGSLLPARPDQPALDYVAESIRFSEPQLIEERRRLITELRNMGFAAVTRDSVTAVVRPVAVDSVDLELRVSTGPRYRYGGVEFDVEGPDRAAPVRTDTLRDAAWGTGRGKHLVTFRIRGDETLKRDLLTRALRLQPGQWYNQSQILATKQRLEATGVFTFTDIESLAPVAASLPHRITVRTRPRHQFNAESFVLQSSGVLGGVGSELGVGLGVSYENANLFGSGEVLTLRSTGSLAADVDTTFFSSSVVELTAAIRLPYLIAPLRTVADRLELYQARTQFSVSYLTARREDMSLIIRGRGSARLGLELRHTPTVTSTVDLMDLSLSQPDTLQGFQSRFLDRILGAGSSSPAIDPVQRAQILEDYTRPQVNNAIRYTLRSERVNPLRRDRGYSHEAALELGGNLPKALDRYVLTPGEVEGSLRLFGFAGSDTRVIYRQYVRVVADLRRYIPLGLRGVLATKLVGGWAHPVGGAKVVPFDRRFFSGGASSVRGWDLRQLGPGAASFGQASRAMATNVLGGDIKLEGSLEWRYTAVQSRLGADWITATFVDVGNVWFGPRNPGFSDVEHGGPSGHIGFPQMLHELGMGSGVGLRASWAYLVARLDLAVRVRDPARPNAGWMPDQLHEPVVYFRFGHTF